MCKTQDDTPTYEDGNLLARLVPNLAPTQEERDILVEALRECMVKAKDMADTDDAPAYTYQSRLDYIHMVAKKALKDTYNQ